MKHIGFCLIELLIVICLLIVSILVSGCGGGGGGRSVFDDRTAINSPHGSVPLDARAYSPNGKYYCQQMPSGDGGPIGVYSCQTNSLVKVVKTLPPESYNALKGLCWSRDSQHIAVMYHAGMRPDINLYSIETGELVRFIGAGAVPYGQYSAYLHWMVFSADNTVVYGSNDGKTILTQYPSGLPTIAKH